MTIAVVDASVAAKWFFPEDDSEAAARLLAPHFRLIAPDLILGEFGNLVWKRQQRGELSADDAAQIVADFLRIPLDVVSSGLLLPTAIKLATATNRTVYDCLYVSLAMSQNCRFVTADQRLANALAALPVARFIRILGKAT